MKKFLFPLVFLLMLAIPMTVSAYVKATTPTIFSACADSTGKIDNTTLTTATIDCSKDIMFSTPVQWNAVGTPGATGAPGIPFSHAACSETGLTGPAQQENLLFCISGIEKDGAYVYFAAINAANAHILVGTPISDIASVDWGGNPIQYVSFTSGFHAEYHPTDNQVRIYNTLNHQVA